MIIDMEPSTFYANIVGIEACNIPDYFFLRLVSLTLYPPDSGPYRGSLAFTFGSKATTSQIHSTGQTS